jgi:hypothetical protein
MNTKDHALDLALETLESIQAVYPCETVGKRITAIKQARSAPVQEPVAWIWKYANGEEEVVFVPPRHVDASHVDAPSTITPLYTTPPGGRQSEDCLTAAPVPDALTDQDPHETPEYKAGWNDCRALMINWRNNQ